MVKVRWMVQIEEPSRAKSRIRWLFDHGDRKREEPRKPFIRIEKALMGSEGPQSEFPDSGGKGSTWRLVNLCVSCQAPYEATAKFSASSDTHRPRHELEIT